MLDWLGSVRIRERSVSRVVLATSAATRAVGTFVAGLGLWLAVMLWPVGVAATAVAGVVVAVGLTVASLERRLVFDRQAGTLIAAQRVLGIGTESVVPLFHLRAVVVMAKPDPGPRARYVAYLDRRVGGAIYLEEARRCAGLLRMAEAIAEVCELRLEYDAGAA